MQKQTNYIQRSKAKENKNTTKHANIRQNMQNKANKHQNTLKTKANETTNKCGRKK